MQRRLPVDIQFLGEATRCAAGSSKLDIGACMSIRSTVIRCFIVLSCVS